MTDTYTTFYQYKLSLANGSGSDLNAGAIKIALVGASYTPDIDNHQYFSDITATFGTSPELSASGQYTSGGVVLQNPTFTNVSHNLKFDCDDLALTGVTTSADIKYLIIYRLVSTPANSPLIGFITLGTAVGGTGVTVNIVMSASGVLTIS
jgi:hypothetical protein